MDNPGEAPRPEAGRPPGPAPETCPAPSVEQGAAPEAPLDAPAPPAPTPAHGPLRRKIEAMIDGLPPDRVSFAVLLDLVAGREGLLVVCIFLVLPFMIPVSIPGMSTVSGMVILLLGLGAALGRRVPVPGRLLRKTLPSERLQAALRRALVWVSRVERLSRPRLPGLSGSRAAELVNGLGVMFGAVLLLFPFAVVPLTNTLPALAVLFLAVAILQRDGLCALIGHALNLLTSAYFAFLLLGGTAIVQKFWREAWAWLTG